MTHDFEQKLSFTLGEKERIDIEMLKNAINGCENVIKTDADIDKTGIDYIATLRNGATINIDAKSREKGASKYWRYGEPVIIKPPKTFPQLQERIVENKEHNNDFSWYLAFKNPEKKM